MTNTKELEKIIEKSGLKYKAIAEMLGITYYSLRKKINNITEFTASEIEMLCKILHIEKLEERQFIFFASNVD